MSTNYYEIQQHTMFVKKGTFRFKEKSFRHNRFKANVIFPAFSHDIVLCTQGTGAGEKIPIVVNKGFFTSKKKKTRKATLLEIRVNETYQILY